MKRGFGVSTIVFAALVSISAALSFAQQKEAVPDRETIERQTAKERQPAPGAEFRFEMEREMQGPGGPPPAGTAGDFVFMATEMSFRGKVVKGAPYSAEAITESLQTLSDGNRIFNRSSAAIYRDNEGRTRREQTLRAIGSFANGEAPKTIFISDPVAGTSYTLDPRTRVVRQMAPMNFKSQPKAPPPGDRPGAGLGAPPPDRIGPGPIAPGRVEPGHVERAGIGAKRALETQFMWGWGNHMSKPESLGKQNIEGVEAEGTRSTVTIPAGEIGNDRAIEIVNELWYSPELQTVVMTRHSDPRFGESSYRLTNIDRSEPAKSLFEVPADYTFKSGPAVLEDNTSTASYSPTGVIAGGVLNGKATRLPLPAYPPIARAAQAAGNVTVEVTIDEDGNVISASAVSGHPLLRAAAVSAARQAKFSPTKLNGQGVKVSGSLVYTFGVQ